jgi:hypothetical protein
MHAPFKMAKVFEPTHRHRIARDHTAMVLLRSPGFVRYDMGRGMWGLDPAESFDADWEPISKPKGSPIMRMFGRQKGKASSSGGS